MIIYPTRIHPKLSHKSSSNACALHQSACQRLTLTVYPYRALNQVLVRNRVAQLSQFLDDPLVVFQAVQPTVVVELGHLTAVLLGQVLGQHVLVQGRHICPVHVDLLLHPLVQE